MKPLQGKGKSNEDLEVFAPTAIQSSRQRYFSKPHTTSQRTRSGSAPYEIQSLNGGALSQANDLDELAASPNANIQRAAPPKQRSFSIKISGSNETSVEFRQR